MICFNTALTACERAQQWPVALDVFQRMVDERLRPTVPLAGIHFADQENETASPNSSWCLMQCFFVKKIFLTFSHLSASIIQVITWNSTMSACSSTLQWQRCLELLRDMRTSQEIDGSGRLSSRPCGVFLWVFYMRKHGEFPHFTGKRWRNSSNENGIDFWNKGYFFLRSVDDRWRSDLFPCDLKVGVFYTVESDYSML